MIYNNSFCLHFYPCDEYAAFDMRLFGKKFECDQCKMKFSKDEELVDHARHVHHHTIAKCADCGKEFVHEEDRLHHARKEHEKKMERRRQKS